MLKLDGVHKKFKSALVAEKISVDLGPCTYGLYHHRKQLRNKVCLQEHVLSCKYQQPEIGRAHV